MSHKIEFQVSESATADRKYFDSREEAFKEAKRLSLLQAPPVYIDVFDLDVEELTNVFYTVTKGKIKTHGGKKVTQ